MSRAAFAALAALLAGCVSLPESTRVKPDAYAGYDCQQIRIETLQVDAQLRAARDPQSRKPVRAVGAVMLLPIPVVVVRRHDPGAALAKLRARQAALNVAAADKRCPVVPDTGAESASEAPGA